MKSLRIAMSSENILQFYNDKFRKIQKRKFRIK